MNLEIASLASDEKSRNAFLLRNSSILFASGALKRTVLVEGVILHRPKLKYRVTRSKLVGYVWL